MNARFDILESTLAVVKNSVTSNTYHINSLEESHREFNKRLVKLEKSYGELCVQNKLLKAKVCDLEGRSRRQNILKLWDYLRRLKKALQLCLSPTCCLNFWEPSVFPGELKWTVHTVSENQVTGRESWLPGYIMTP